MPIKKTRRTLAQMGATADPGLVAFERMARKAAGAQPTESKNFLSAEATDWCRKQWAKRGATPPKLSEMGRWTPRYGFRLRRGAMG